jgi:hypothetical protein
MLSQFKDEEKPRGVRELKLWDAMYKKLLAFYETTHFFQAPTPFWLLLSFGIAKIELDRAQYGWVAPRDARAVAHKTHDKQLFNWRRCTGNL